MFGELAADEGAMEAVAAHLRVPSAEVDRTGSEGGLAIGLGTALAELEESTARVVSLRHKLERLAVQVADRQQVLLGLEDDLSAARVSAEHDRVTISRLERDLDGRASLLDRLRTELAALAGELGAPRDNR